jgi:mycothiol synthase
MTTNNTYPAPGLRLRAPQISDADAVAQLTLDVCSADGDPTVASAPADIRRMWSEPGFDLKTDAWVVEASDGKIVGYEEFFNQHAFAALDGDGYVHPEYLGQGIGTALLRVLDTRARQAMEKSDPQLRVFIRNGMSMMDTRACEMHENEGYHSVRFSWRMEIKLDAAPSLPAWPDGIDLRPFDMAAHDFSVYQAHEEAFRDHWGHTPDSFERWQHNTTGRENFDPTLWFIAWDGDEVAGYSLCRYREEVGWVGSLGVRRPWRKHGLGLALLDHSFGEFYRRGTKTVSLGVDAASPTGATRLYQKAGMRVASEFVIYEKELRPGREPGENERIL